MRIFATKSLSRKVFYVVAGFDLYCVLMVETINCVFWHLRKLLKKSLCLSGRTIKTNSLARTQVLDYFQKEKHQSQKTVLLWDQIPLKQFHCIQIEDQLW